MGLNFQKGGFLERKTFHSLDEDRSIRFNNFLIFYFIFNLVIFINILLFLLLLT